MKYGNTEMEKNAKTIEKDKKYRAGPWGSFLF